jgi:hypothetical protein
VRTLDVGADGRMLICCGISTDAAFFPTTKGAFQTKPGGDVDACLICVDGSGTEVLSTFLGGTSIDYASTAVFDALGNIWVVGYTRSSEFPTTEGAHRTEFQPTNDGYAIRLSPDGSKLQYGTFIGSEVSSIEAGRSGRLHLIGLARDDRLAPAAGGATPLAPAGGGAAPPAGGPPPKPPPKAPVLKSLLSVNPSPGHETWMRKRMSGLCSRPSPTKLSMPSSGSPMGDMTNTSTFPASRACFA